MTNFNFCTSFNHRDSFNLTNIFLFLQLSIQDQQSVSQAIDQKQSEVKTQLSYMKSLEVMAH
jgi:hypothetical protein